MKRLALLLAVAGLLAAAPALGQQRRTAPPPVAPAEPAPELPPAYEPDLLRLAETLGLLAYLGDLCRENDRAEWPKRMQQLLEAEGLVQVRRQRLAGAYNRGFLGHQATHRACS
ncbi:MAG: TIGR02301 family protein, partial [Beijerinckiaceae bacterium]